MKTLAVFLVLIATASLCGAPQTNASKAAILSGLQKATVIVSGTSQGSAAGGGGVSTQLKVDEVFVGEPSLRGKVITVFWLDGKTNERASPFGS